jgi:hypothetical protein
VDILSSFQQNLIEELLQHIHFTVQWTDRHTACHPATCCSGMQHQMYMVLTSKLLVVSLLKILYQIFLISLHGFWVNQFNKNLYCLSFSFKISSEKYQHSEKL